MILSLAGSFLCEATPLLEGLGFNIFRIMTRFTRTIRLFSSSGAWNLQAFMLSIRSSRLSASISWDVLYQSIQKICNSHPGLTALNVRNFITLHVTSACYTLPVVYCSTMVWPPKLRPEHSDNFEYWKRVYGMVS